MSARALRWWPAVAIMLVLGLVAGCGDDGDASTQVEDPAGDTAAEGTVPDAVDEATGGGDGFDCPLTAAEVGEIVGAAVEKDDSTCTYTPPEGLPAVGFIAQLAELCDQGFPEANGYTEPVEDLGVDAFLKTDGEATAELWVCAPDAFLVYVDTGESDPSTAVTQVGELASRAVAAG